MQHRTTAAYAETVRQIEEAFRWWATFGGLGARTRRGLGAFAVTDVAGAGFSYVSADEVAQAGLRLVLGKPQPNANTAWQDAIEALREYRQGVGVGRHPPSRGHCSPAGRSCWPEADALRRLVGQHADDHPPTHPACNIFPRAAFGLPIIFHFKDAGEPADSVCLPLLGVSTRTRLASPLILRPLYLSFYGFSFIGGGCELMAGRMSRGPWNICERGFFSRVYAAKAS